MKMNLWTIAAALATLAPLGVAAPAAAAPALSGDLAPRVATPGLEKRATKFTFGGSTKMRGVNLGSWLIIEPWMMSDTFPDHDNARDEWTQTDNHGGPSGFKSWLQNHYKTWITTDDIQQIADAGLNTVRIPIGWWNLLAPIDNDHYVHDAGAMDALKPIVQKANELGLYVILVMHGLPGSQNAQDNSGHLGQYDWFNNGNYIGKSWDMMKILTDEFAHYGSGIGIELMNEAKPMDDNHNTNGRDDKMKAYYLDCYKYIRGKSQDMAVVLSDGWMDLGPNGPWWGWAKSNGLKNVVMDNHVYLIYNENQNIHYAERLDKVCQERDKLSTSQRNIPTIVGEWTIASGWDCDPSNEDCDRTRYMQQMFGTQAKIYEATTNGWVYWTWKTESEDDDWSYQNSMRKGYIPKHLGDPQNAVC